MIDGSRSPWRVCFHLVEGDHAPSHVHVYGKNGKLISRVKLDTMEPMDAARIDRRIVAIIRDLQKEGRL